MKITKALHALLCSLAAAWLIEAAVTLGIAASMRPSASRPVAPDNPAPTPGPLRAVHQVQPQCHGQQCRPQQPQSVTPQR